MMIHKKNVFILMGLWVLGSPVFAAVSNEYTHDFWLPMYHAQRLDYCLANQQACGPIVADKYCRLQGYDRARRSVIAYNVGVTHYIDKSTGCKSWQCSGFKLIECSAQTRHQPRRDYYYRSKRFVMPRFNHYRVAWCYENGEHCGEPAALAFCRQIGYAKATAFTEANNLAATRALGNQRLCFGNACQGFASITCYR